ncbi:arylsulfatase A-like enzyme [Bradyrhizobium sp. LM4.3]
MTKPHIVLVMTDQQRFDTIAATGHPYMKTPNLDRLVREGIYFDNCFINAPSCVPSRAALFSGLYPHASGVLKNGQHWQKTWVSNLAEAGYHCVNVGKMHTIPYDAKAGFHERFVVENKDRFLEGRWFADELDKAFATHKLTKPSRAGYRSLPDYGDRMGAFTLGDAEVAASGHFCRRDRDVVAGDPPQAGSAVHADRPARTAPAL